MIFDVAIIGASLAGASLAIRLARSGLFVALIDREEFPRRKACGEGLSDLGILEIEQLGLGKKLFELPHQPFRGYEIHGDHYVTSLASLDGSAKGIGIERFLLDNLLLQSAIQAGAEFFSPMTVRSVARDADGVFHVRGRDAVVGARLLVVASGPGAAFTRMLGLGAQGQAQGIKSRRLRATPRFGWNVLMQGAFLVPLDRVPILRQRGYQVYFTAVANDRLNVAVTIDSPIHAAAVGPSDDFLRQLEQLAEATVGFRGRVSGNVFGAPSFRQSAAEVYGDRLVLIGDAAETFDPIGGMGMSHAMLSSRLAADAILKSLSRQNDSATFLATYAAQRESAARLLRGFTWLTLQSVLKLGDTRIFSSIARGPLGAALIATAQRPLPSDGLLPRGIRRATSYAGQYLGR